jgi:flagellar basal-body rod protein FlgG
MHGAIYTAASGALAQERRLMVLANNISNINTAGFKKDIGVFKVLDADKDADVNPIESAHSSTPPQEPLYLHFKTSTDFSQGHLKKTDNPFDLAQEGKGFFCVQTPEGFRYTRNGHFTLDSQGLLATQDGYTVIGDGGEISIDGHSFSVDMQGNISVDGAQVDKLRIVEFADPLVLEKVGDTLFAARDTHSIEENPEGVQVRQGYLELSNVDPVRMMTEMIEVLRGYESYQKAIRALDDASAKSINEVGQVA